MFELKRKICAGCKQRLPATAKYFHKHHSMKDGLQYSCKKCKAVANKIYLQTEKGKISLKLRVARYQKTEKGKAATARQKPNRDAYRKSIVGHLRRTFYNIVARCTNPNQQGYKWYGGVGIKCLFTSSDEFVDYVINELQIDSRGLDIDRINNDGNYERGNIRFVTHKENCQNK